MTLVSLKNVFKSFGTSPVLKNISWQIEEKRKIGLLGSNGAGKTTLFRIIAGELEPDKGELARNRYLKIGFLRQEYQLEDDLTLFDEMLKPFSELLKLREEMRDLENRMSLAKDSKKLLKHYGQLQLEYENRGGYSYENKIERVLYGLGFKKEDFVKSVNVLSGGEKNRAALASVLLFEPNLLLLDEPTNHLDIEGTEWLEQYLSEFSGTIIMVSHDRYFLDRVIGEVVELEEHRIERHRGNFSAYQRKKVERLEKALKEHKEQREYVLRTEEFIRRNIAGQKTKQAKSRRKALEKLERLEKPKTRPKKVKISFSATKRSSRALIWTEKLSKNFKEKTLFENVNFSIERYDRVGLIGPNGCGKTTFLKILLAEEKPTSGEASIGSSLEVGYYDQEHRDLDCESSVLDEVWKIDPRMLMEELRSFLGKFLFCGEDVFRRIKSFSGGEQSRVVLAKLILSQPNFLILDEPTNHLDIVSREVLENALAEFEGTILVVSHDRYFLNKIVNKIYAFENGSLKEYLGNYSHYEQKKKKQKEEEKRLKELKKEEKKKPKKVVKSKPKLKKRSSEEINEDILKTELELKDIEFQLLIKEVSTNWEKLLELNQRKEKLSRRLEELYAEWGESAED